MIANIKFSKEVPPPQWKLRKPLQQDAWMEIITTCDHVISFYVKNRKMTLSEIPPAWILSSRPMSVPGIKYQSFFEDSVWIFTGSLFDRVNFTTVDRYDLRDTHITYKSPQETFS
jgi:hypothetical protein